MNTGRLEAFSDGVFAVAITIMVLEIKAPPSYELEALRPLIAEFISYLLSFLYIGIYWNNHHHLMQAAERVSGMTLWANLHLLFWITLVPFVTGWMGHTKFDTWPVASYGFVLMMCALAWQLLRASLLKTHSQRSVIGRALRRPLKEWTSTGLYLCGITVAVAGHRFWPDLEKFTGMIGCVFYGAVAVIWFLPDRRIERVIEAQGAPAATPPPTR